MSILHQQHSEIPEYHRVIFYVCITVISFVKVNFEGKSESNLIPAFSDRVYAIFHNLLNKDDFTMTCLPFLPAFP